MIELIAYAQKPQVANDSVGKQFVLDVANPGSISLTYQVGKGDEVLGRFSPFTQTFRLPFTNVNTQFFGHYYDVNIDPKAVNNAQVPQYSIHYKAYCEIRVDGVPIIQGSLQLKNIHLKAEEFEVVVYGLEADLFQDIKDLKLIDAFKSSAGVVDIDYDVLMTSTNIKSSFDLNNDVTEGTIGAGVVVFPIIDYGHTEPYNFIFYRSDSTGLGGLATPNYLQPCELKPSFNVKHLFEKIINNAGYFLEDTPFLNSTAFTKLFMTLASDRAKVATRGIQGVQAGRTDNAVIQTFTSASFNAASVVPLNVDSGPGFGTPPNPSLLYDEGDHYNTTTASFIAPNDGFFIGEVYGSFDSSNCTTNFGALVRVIARGGSIGSDSGVSDASEWTSLPGASGTATILTTVSTTWSGFLEAGQGVEMLVQVNVPGGPGILKLMSSGTYLIVQASQMNNGYASIPYNMPDIKQSDFIKDLAERFNLCIVSNADNPAMLRIEPWQDYIDDKAHKDWTHKLDLSQSRTLKSTDTLKKQLIHFHDAEDTTNINTKQQELLGHTLGEFRQEIAGDFVEGTLENKAIFAPFNVQKIPRIDGLTSDASDFLVAREYSPNTEGPVSDASPKLFYHNGLKTLGAQNSFFIGETESTFYPLCLPFYNAGNTIAVDSPMLLWDFAVPPSFYGPVFGTTPSNQGYFARYYQQFLLSIYDDEARLMECSMMLNPTDIFNFRFNDEIQIENTAFRVLKISNYQPFADVPCKVELLKLVEKQPSLYLPDPNQECNLNVHGLSANGNVIFVDPTTGTTSSGTEICCTENHYFWNGDDCIWNTGGGGGGGGKPTNSDPNLEWVQPKNYLTGSGGFNSIMKSGIVDANPIIGEHSIRGMNVTSQAPSVNKEFVFYATTYGSVARIATENGDASLNGSGSFNLPEGFMARFVVRALTIQTDSGTTSGEFGAQSFKVWTFIARNVGGTITTSGTEQTDFAQSNGTIGTRTVNVASAKGRPGQNTNNEMGLAIVLTGTADTVIAWHLDCSATFIDLSSYAAFNSDLILLENMGYLETESGDFIQQN